MGAGILTSKLVLGTNTNYQINGSGDSNHDIKQIIYGRASLRSIKVHNTQGNAITLDFYDNGETITKDASGNTVRTNDLVDSGSAYTITLGKLIHRCEVGTGTNNFDFDFHGAMLEKGLLLVMYASPTTGNDNPGTSRTKVGIGVSAQYN